MSQVAKAERKRDRRQQERGKPPDGFLCFLWLITHWKTYWRALIGFAIFFVFVANLGPIGQVVFDKVRSFFSSVTVKVISFNHSTGEISLEFNNKTQISVPIDSVYITVSPTNGIPMKPLPPEFQSLVSIFDKNVLRIPGGAGLEIGSFSEENNGRKINMVLLLVRQDSPVVLSPGPTSTNIVPYKTAFTGICDQFATGAEFDVVLHTSLIDADGRLRRQDIPLGKYFIGENHKGLKKIPYPKEVDILRLAKRMGSSSERMFFSFSRSLELPPLDDKVYGAIIENDSPNDILVPFGEHIEGLVPIILLKKAISYGCNFSVELINNEKLPSDFSAWVLTRDQGQTVMNVLMAFSNSWSNVEAAPTPGKEYTISLPATNWHVLVEGKRWARIKDGAVKFKVNEDSWLKFLPASDATTSLLISNYNRIASQDVHDDPSWVVFTNKSLLSRNSNPVLLVKNEAKPDFAMFSKIRWPDTPTTNTTSGDTEGMQSGVNKGEGNASY